MFVHTPFAVTGCFGYAEIALGKPPTWSFMGQVCTLWCLKELGVEMFHKKNGLVYLSLG